MPLAGYIAWGCMKASATQHRRVVIAMLPYAKVTAAPALAEAAASGWTFCCTGTTFFTTTGGGGGGGGGG